MKRGVLKLNNQEIKLINTWLKTSNINVSKLLEQKLTKESLKESFIEFSEEDIELILDSIPAPSNKDNQMIITTRIKIQQFLRKLRLR